MKIQLYLIVRLLIVLLSAFTVTVNAVAENGSRIVMQHLPTEANDLPSPGDPLIVSVVVNNTKSVDLPLRALFVIDGNLTPVALKRAYLNRFDEPTYEFELPSPVAEMSYQFVLPQDNAAPITTKRFIVQRECVPRELDLLPQIETTSDGSARMRLQIEKSESLRIEIRRYEQLLSLLDEIDKLTDGKAGKK
jgi:hypothetical protein